jgi:diguanylate cyclase (GGDEF)-like protein
MMTPAKPENEDERLAELRSLSLLDSDPDERFDRITRLAQRLFDVPSAVISLVDSDRTWYLSKQGYDGVETSREESFCAYAILGHDVMQVPDATKDERFADNPYVLENPGVRFYAGCNIAGPHGSVLGTLCIFDTEAKVLSSEDTSSLRDLAGMVESEIATLQLAASDPLTGLSNRRGFELSATMLLEVCRHRGIKATLLFFDLDDFKSINDTYGHEEGDEALKQFAKHLQSTFRNSDIVARYGGDEFVVLLANAGDPSLALGRLQQDLLSRNLHPTTRYPLNVAIGSAVFDGAENDTLSELLERADKAMYDDKRRHQEDL